MTAADDRAGAGRLRGHAVEQAAVEWVMAYERSQGREPVDRRHERAFPGDIESPPRIIEIKAAAGAFRGDSLWLETVQVEAARIDPDFFLYVVENVGPGDPAGFNLRVLSGEALRRLVGRAVERRYFEVPWPVAEYDSTPLEQVGPLQVPEQVPTRPSGADSGRPATARTLAAAIRDALVTLGGSGTVGEVVGLVSAAHPGRWRPASVSAEMADLAFPGPRSSPYPPERRFLERLGTGRYRLRSP